MRSPRSSTVSTASRVVPGISLTISRSRPRSALTRLDLPTFGRPRIATRIASSGSEGRPAGASRSSSATIAVEQVAAARARAGPRSGSGRRARAGAARARAAPALGSSILFASTSTGLCDSRRICATSSSPGVTPARASTTKRTRSASSTASRACCAIARVSGVGSAMSTPPVSTSTKRLPVHSQTSSFRSRVTPGISCTTAARVSVSRLTSVDLPTFGKPTIATAPSSGGGGARLEQLGLVAHAESVTDAPSSRAGGTATRGRPASCRSRSQAQSRCSSASICADASR